MCSGDDHNASKVVVHGVPEVFFVLRSSRLTSSVYAVDDDKLVLAVLEPRKVAARLPLLILIVVGVVLSTTNAPVFAQTEYSWTNQTCCLASYTTGTSYAVGKLRLKIRFLIGYFFD